MRNLHIDGKKFRLPKKHSHVAVQMRRVDSRSYGSFNLRADLAVRVFRFYILRGWLRFWPEIARRIKKTGYFILRPHRAPAIDFPFAGQREMQT